MFLPSELFPDMTSHKMQREKRENSDWVDAGEEERNWGLRGTKVLFCFLTPSFTRLQNTVLANDGHHSQGTLLTLPHYHTAITHREYCSVLTQLIVHTTAPDSPPLSLNFSMEL